jgi:hypothetical protein
MTRVSQCPISLRADNALQFPHLVLISYAHCSTGLELDTTLRPTTVSPSRYLQKIRLCFQIGISNIMYIIARSTCEGESESKGNFEITLVPLMENKCTCYFSTQSPCTMMHFWSRSTSFFIHSKKTLFDCYRLHRLLDVTMRAEPLHVLTWAVGLL